MRMRASSHLLALFGSLSIGAACSDSKAPAAPPRASEDAAVTVPALTSSADYLITVRTADWNESRGSLTRWRRAGSGWEADGSPIPIVLGRTGLAWGRGAHGDGKPEGQQDGSDKREGDGRSPAGAFWIDHTYGYADQAPEGSRVPYSVMTPTLQCIEDIKSAYYNQIVDREKVAPDWSSTDLLRRKDGLYEFIAFVQHNTAPAIPGRGSCILLHVWTSPTTPTAGCTSMKREDLATVVAALAPAKNLLVQLPEAVYADVKEAWGLPAW